MIAKVLLCIYTVRSTMSQRALLESECAAYCGLVDLATGEVIK